MKYIIVQTQFEGFHSYPGAPQDVDFLQFNHRHMFHIRAEVEVFHDDRELEIIMVKRAINHTFADRDWGRCSCEEIASEIQNYIKDAYPVPPVHGAASRVVNVEVIEDGENGAKVQDDQLIARHVVPTFDGVPEDVQYKKSEKPAVIPHVGSVHELLYANGDGSYIQRLIDDVVKLDRKFGLDKDMELNTSNLMFLSNALAGEVGELANFVKKIVRDGASKELWEQFDFEVVDCFIYLVKLILLARVDFDNAWDEKHHELEGRYTSGKKHLDYSTRPLDRDEQ